MTNEKLLKEKILKTLKKTYPYADDDIFNQDSYIFDDDDNFDADELTCRLTINPDKTLTIAIKAEICSTNAQETRDGVIIKHYGWDAYNQKLKSIITSHYTISETVFTLTEIVPAIKTMIEKINNLRFND